MNFCSKKTQRGKTVDSPLCVFPSDQPALRARSAGSGVLLSGSGLGSSAAVCPQNSSPALPPAVSVLPSSLTVAAKEKAEQ